MITSTCRSIVFAKKPQLPGRWWVAGGPGHVDCSDIESWFVPWGDGQTTTPRLSGLKNNKGKVLKHSHHLKIVLRVPTHNFMLFVHSHIREIPFTPTNISIAFKYSHHICLCH